MSTSTLWPARILFSCVSLKFAVTQTSSTGTICTTAWPNERI